MPESKQSIVKNKQKFQQTTSETETNGSLDEFDFFFEDLILYDKDVKQELFNEYVSKSIFNTNNKSYDRSISIKNKKTATLLIDPNLNISNLHKKQNSYISVKDVENLILKKNCSDDYIYLLYKKPEFNEIEDRFFKNLLLKNFINKTSKNDLSLNKQNFINTTINSSEIKNTKQHQAESTNLNNKKNIEKFVNISKKMQMECLKPKKTCLKHSLKSNHIEKEYSEIKDKKITTKNEMKIHEEDQTSKRDNHVKKTNKNLNVTALDNKSLNNNEIRKKDLELDRNILCIELNNGNNSAENAVNHSNEKDEFQTNLKMNINTNALKESNTENNPRIMQVGDNLIIKDPIKKTKELNIETYIKEYYKYKYLMKKDTIQNLPLSKDTLKKSVILQLNPYTNKSKKKNNLFSKKNSKTINSLDKNNNVYNSLKISSKALPTSSKELLRTPLKFFPVKTFNKPLNKEQLELKELVINFPTNHHIINYKDSASLKYEDLKSYKAPEIIQMSEDELCISNISYKFYDKNWHLLINKNNELYSCYRYQIYSVSYSNKLLHLNKKIF